MKLDANSRFQWASIENSRLGQLGLLLCLVFFSQVTQAAPGTTQSLMSVKPKQCVAMKQGNACFVVVEVKWKLPRSGQYCLYSSQQKQAIECWSGQTQGRIELDVEARDNVSFVIRAKNAEQPLLSGLIKMAWVYKKKGKPRTSWRLF